MFENILLSIDLNEENSWKKALPTAVEYAKAFGSALHVAAVVPDFGLAIVGGFFPDNFEEKALAEFGEKLKAFCQEHVPADVKVKPVVGHGRVYEEILKIAGETGTDLIVMGARRPELKDYLLGPNAARVVRHADCSVLVVRD